jgi:hypothetical protein
MPPKFMQPSSNNQEFQLLENKIGKVAEIKVKSNNSEELAGSINLRFLSVSPSEMASKFSLEYVATNDTWILNCIDKIKLKDDGNDELIE